MEKITVVDAMMGRGKTSAAIRYMLEHTGDKRFLYVTPYLSEVSRVCEQCDCGEPTDTFATKMASLEEMMSFGMNVATTHSLFSHISEKCLKFAKNLHYTLIVDEELPVVDSIVLSKPDMNILMKNCICEDDEGHVTWTAEEYSGVFREYMIAAKRGNLYRCSAGFFEMLDPHRFTAFDDVFLLTYMFGGSLQKGYFEYFDIPFTVVGIETDECGLKFSDRPDTPPPVDYSELINIIGPDFKYPDQLNAIGDKRTALSANWYKQRSRNHPDIKKMRANLRTFLERRTDGSADEKIWTVFKTSASDLYGPRNRYSTSFIPMNTRATNAHRNATAVAYLVNRFVDPNLVRLFSTRGVSIDQDKYALAEMLQFVWRSAIRDGKPINLYVPSKRMRKLLQGWIKEVSQEDRDAA